MAGARSLLAMSLLPSELASDVFVLVAVVFAVPVRMLPIDVVLAIVVGNLLVSAFELVNLLICAGQWVRSPFRSAVVVDRTVVATQCFGSVGSSFTSSLMMLLNVGGYSLDVVVVP